MPDWFVIWFAFYFSVYLHPNLWILWVEKCLPHRPANLDCKSVENCLQFLNADRLRKQSSCGFVSMGCSPSVSDIPNYIVLQFGANVSAHSKYSYIKLVWRTPVWNHPVAQAQISQMWHVWSWDQLTVVAESMLTDTANHAPISYLISSTLAT